MEIGGRYNETWSDDVMADFTRFEYPKEKCIIVSLCYIIKLMWFFIFHLYARKTLQRRNLNMCICTYILKNKNCIFSVKFEFFFFCLIAKEPTSVLSRRYYNSVGFTDDKVCIHVVYVLLKQLCNSRLWTTIHTTNGKVKFIRRLFTSAFPLCFKGSTQFVYYIKNVY